MNEITSSLETSVGYAGQVLSLAHAVAVALVPEQAERAKLIITRANLSAQGKT